MKFLKGLFIGLFVIIVGLVAYGFMLPDLARVERSIVIASRPSTVYAVLNGFHSFDRWSPWAELDPKAVFTLEGPPVGVGARATWSSTDPNVGSGSQEILESQANALIRIKLIFEGFEADSYSIYEIAPAGEGTRVNWVYESVFHGNLLHRYFGLLLDDMIGKDYEKGLGKLKAFVEGLPQDDFTGLAPEVVQLPSTPLVSIPGEAAAPQAAEALRAAYARLAAFLQASGRRAVDAPIAITRSYDENTHEWKFDAALPIDQACTTPAEGGSVLCRTLEPTWAIRVVHHGPVTSIAATYRKLAAFKAATGLMDNGNAWERYVKDASSAGSAELVTEIYWPVK